MPTPPKSTASTLGSVPTAGRIATLTQRSDGMKAPDRRRASALPANPRPVGRLSRRRLVVLLAVGTATLAVLSGCGEESRQPGGYNFPGAEKDASGNFKMRGFG